MKPKMIKEWDRGGVKGLLGLWSMRASLGSAAFWGAVTMLAAMWPSFFGLMPLWAYGLIGLALGMAVAVARVLKQPGAE